MTQIQSQPVQVEPFNNSWRVVTRSHHSGRCLKVWAEGDRENMELLALGINKQKKVFESDGK